MNILIFYARFLLLITLTPLVIGQQSSVEGLAALFGSAGSNSNIASSSPLNNDKYSYESFTQSEHSNLLNQIQQYDDAEESEFIERETLDKKLELAFKLCREDENACQLLENYKNFKDKGLTLSQKKLEVFGVDLFYGYPLSFNQSDKGGVPESYPLQIGDRLKVQVIGAQQSIQENSFIERSGEFMITGIGGIQIAGQTLEEAKKNIKAFVETQILGARVIISLESINTIQAYALGLVNNPGAYRLSATSKAINGIIASGGFTEKSSLRTIKITRGDPNEERVIDLYDFLIDGKTNSDFYLRNGDSILVQARQNSVSISGSVNRPAIYEFLEGERFSDLLSFALGLSENADKENISLRRKNEYGQYTTSQVNLSADFKLKNGDIISIGSAEGEWVQGVELIGAIRNVGEYAYSEGLTLGKLIKLDRDLLNSTYPSIVTIKRFSSITRSYSYLVLDLLSQERLNKFLLSKGDKVYIYSYEDVTFLSSKYVMQALMPDQASSVAVEKVLLNGEVVNQNACLDSLMGFSSNDFVSTTLLKFKVAKPSNNVICTSMFMEQPTLLPILLNRSIPIFGDITNPGLYPISPYVKGKEVLQIAGSEVYSINNTYNYEVGYFSNSKIQVDNNLDNSNLKFLSVSSLSGIPNEAFVELVGEFQFPGVYKIDGTTTLSEIINRAGGLKDNAFPAGGILTRDSLKAKEEELLKRAESELITIITQGITTGVIKQSSEDVLGLIGLIRQLGTTEPIGRLVVELDPVMLSRDKSKDILLRSEDKIYMPSASNTITISGSVLNPITVAYDPSKNLKDYISLAGGYTEGAQTGDTYIIMPNGQSIKGSTLRSFFSDEYIRPGATIIVPRKARPLSGLSLVEAITPILANLSITMASIVSITDRS